MTSVLSRSRVESLEGKVARPLQERSFESGGTPVRLCGGCGGVLPHICRAYSG